MSDSKSSDILSDGPVKDILKPEYHPKNMLDHTFPCFSNND